ncbi:MAG: VirB4 family type IV secretion system protein [Verrucomicrobiota bacterium]
MSELRVTDTNAANDAAGEAFGLSGNLYLPVVAAAVGSLGLWAILGFAFRVQWIVAGLIGAAPFALVLGWVVLLKQGKPPGYDRDRIEQFLGGGDFCRQSGNPHVLMVRLPRRHAKAPEGYFAENLILFGSLECGSIAAKGYAILPSDLRGARHTQLNALQDRLRSLLASLGPGQRLQFQWSCDADYRPELTPFHETTEGIEEPHLRQGRNARVTRAAAQMEARELRRERLVLFLTVDVTAYAGNLRSASGLERHYAKILQQLHAQFDEFTARLTGLLGGEATVRPMDDLGHYTCMAHFLNPGLAGRGGFDAAAAFDPALSIQENCLLGDGVAVDTGFFLDGNYHQVLAVTRWPQKVSPGILLQLTGLAQLDYRITVNVEPLHPTPEIHREEKAIERLQGEYTDRRRHSLLVAMQKKERKIESLASGFSQPFQVQYLIRVWDPTREGLRAKTLAVQDALNRMNGAQSYACDLPVTAKKLFFATWPGWTGSSYRHRDLYAEDRYLADLLPFSATFTGHLDGAEALYDGSHRNLVGVRTFVGGSPQHTLLLGMTGVGKSFFVEDLLFQTAAQFVHTAIIEEGFSYQRFTKACGETPIVIHPDSPLTINYLDTQGMPLNSLHLASAVALVARMIGEPADPEQAQLRQAQITHYIQRLYRDAADDWSRRHPQEAREAQRLACAVHRWHRTKFPLGATLVEAYADLRDRQRNGDDEVLNLLAGLTEEDVTRFCKEPATEPLAVNTLFAFFGPSEYPTHSALVELMAYARAPEHPKEDIDRLATLLSAWTAHGPYGRLFDGQTNVSLQRRIAYFELGYIPEQAVELKTAAGLLISGFTRQHLITLPRGQRKRIVFEELARFLDVPGGEKIVAEGYAQLRKFNTWVIAIVQQYAQFKRSRIRPAVMGNAKQFFLMRQSDRSDLADIAADIALPESAVDAIQDYPLPEQMPAHQRYSSVCYYAPAVQPPLCGTLRHIPPS